MYTIENPKKVIYHWDPEEENFTGVVKDEDGTIAYFLNGKINREDGPAVIWTNGTIFYYKHGKSNRIDGPAIIYADGGQSYYLNNKHLCISTDQELKDYLMLRMFE